MSETEVFENLKKRIGPRWKAPSGNVNNFIRNWYYQVKDWIPGIAPYEIEELVEIIHDYVNAPQFLQDYKNTKMQKYPVQPLPNPVTDFQDVGMQTFGRLGSTGFSAVKQFVLEEAKSRGYLQ